jgi:hypothetical protein
MFLCLMVIPGLDHVQMQTGRARSMSPGKVSHIKNIPDCFLKMVSLNACHHNLKHQIIWLLMQTNL